ncbi:MAG: formylglycine-generating enzyme family protein [Candidatus Competibacteraceae bacterium]|nr:formylglycine-generating enzyme family protein [Candidatus Competibacteraceae bacterium]
MIPSPRQSLSRDASLPDEFPTSWACEWGQDRYGVWLAFRLRGVRQCLRWLPPGEFWMGSPQDEPYRSDDEILHRVKLTRGFWLADTACTQALWEVVTGVNPSHFKGAQRPVEKVSWEDVQDFIQRLNGLVPGGGFRLPTEAEWEYACRADTRTPYWFGNEITRQQANFGAEETVEVRARPCNGWGLYQMHGNVWEWCSDSMGSYDKGPVSDPTGPAEGEDRVLRGGGWIYDGRDLRSAHRNAIHFAIHSYDFGFRLARGRAVGG